MEKKELKITLIVEKKYSNIKIKHNCTFFLLIIAGTRGWMRRQGGGRRPPRRRGFRGRVMFHNDVRQLSGHFWRFFSSLCLGKWFDGSLQRCSRWCCLLHVVKKLASLCVRASKQNLFRNDVRHTICS